MLPMLIYYSYRDILQAYSTKCLGNIAYEKQRWQLIMRVNWTTKKFYYF